MGYLHQTPKQTQLSITLIKHLTDHLLGRDPSGPAVRSKHSKNSHIMGLLNVTTSSHLLLYCPRDPDSHQPNVERCHLQLKTSQIAAKCNHSICHPHI